MSTKVPKTVEPIEVRSMTVPNDVLEVSDCGYGIAEAALRDVLNREVPK
jgi:signal transduction histidine kinase